LGSAGITTGLTHAVVCAARKKKGYLGCTLYQPCGEYFRLDYEPAMAAAAELIHLHQGVIDARDMDSPLRHQPDAGGWFLCWHGC
jgi:hypothetical protein